MIIPIAKPYIGKEEAKAAKDAILSGWVAQGPKVKEFEEVFATYVGSKYACAVSSGTAALHLALLAVGTKSKDVVITVSHSFIATANSIRYCGAEPVFVDIDLNTYNMSAEALEKCLTKDCKIRNGKLIHKLGRVAAIMPVHQMGMPCDLKAILPLARKFHIPVVEDAACAAGSEIKIGDKWERIGKPHGDIACFSFHPRKIITTGEGGMLTTNNKKYEKKLRILRNQGMEISNSVKRSSKKVNFERYSAVGYNYRLTDIQAGIGIEQLKKLPAILLRRRKTARYYAEKLRNISWLKLPKEPVYCRSNWQSYPIRLLEGAPLKRNELMQYLLNIGISTRGGIMNAHQEKPYVSDLWLKNSEIARDSVIILPLFYGMIKNQVGRVIERIENV